MKSVFTVHPLGSFTNNDAKLDLADDFGRLGERFYESKKSSPDSF
jgi:hypothetical protein|tara:strand:- start:435 stop:569 length:135 start_codon:yes stop_codon:yes gene_type:complete